MLAEKVAGGSGPPLTMYTPIEMRPIAAHSIADGHSPRIGMANRAVIAGHEAANAAPLDAPRIPMARPYTIYEMTAVKTPCTSACSAIAAAEASKRLPPARTAYGGTYSNMEPTAEIAAAWRPARRARRIATV